MERLSMRMIREVLRLKFECGLSDRQIAKSTGIARSSIGDYVRRFHDSGLVWPLSAGFQDLDLESCLFPPPPSIPADRRALPDWIWVHQELRRKGVTLFLLWQEYKAAHPEGFQYSWFCVTYQAWRGRRDLVMRQTHRAGEKLFVDFCGMTVPLTDRQSGEIRPAQIFVAVMGASNYTYAEAVASQGLADWIGAHVRAFAFFGGVTEVLVPDNLASGVTKTCRYEPDIQTTYAEMAAHYGVAVVPARVRKPKDKAKVEAGVLLVERWVLARLRNQVFCSLTALNQAIRELLERLNQRPFKKLPGSRRSTFESLDRPALKPLPAIPYELAYWKRVKVHVDYHVEVDEHYYSVPHALVGRQLDVRYTANTVEMFHHGQRVAAHAKVDLRGRHTTVESHMPPHHRFAKWSPERLVRWAEKTGPATAGLVSAILRSRRHPEQGYRSCLGILRLGERYGAARLEAACQRAVSINALSYRSVESILSHGLDAQPLTPPEPAPRLLHDNLRGPEYFH
jgi:transposase